MGKYVNIGEEFVMDFIMQTRRGKKIDPGFGNKLSWVDVIGEKSAPPKPLVLKDLLCQNYDKTIVKIAIAEYKYRADNGKIKTFFKTMDIELNRIIIPRKIKSMYPNCTEVYYENVGSGECSKYYFFKVENIRES